MRASYVIGVVSYRTDFQCDENMSMVHNAESRVEHRASVSVALVVAVLRV